MEMRNASSAYTELATLVEKEFTILVEDDLDRDNTAKRWGNLIDRIDEQGKKCGYKPLYEIMLHILSGNYSRDDFSQDEKRMLGIIETELLNMSDEAKAILNAQSFMKTRASFWRKKNTELEKLGGEIHLKYLKHMFKFYTSTCKTEKQKLDHEQWEAYQQVIKGLIPEAKCWGKAEWYDFRNVKTMLEEKYALRFISTGGYKSILYTAYYVSKLNEIKKGSYDSWILKKIMGYPINYDVLYALCGNYYDDLIKSLFWACFHRISHYRTYYDAFYADVFNVENLKENWLTKAVYRMRERGELKNNKRDNNIKNVLMNMYMNIL